MNITTDKAFITTITIVFTVWLAVFFILCNYPDYAINLYDYFANLITDADKMLALYIASHN